MNLLDQGLVRVRYYSHPYDLKPKIECVEALQPDGSLDLRALGMKLKVEPVMVLDADFEPMLAPHQYAVRSQLEVAMQPGGYIVTTDWGAGMSILHDDRHSIFEKLPIYPIITFLHPRLRARQKFLRHRAEEISPTSPTARTPIDVPTGVLIDLS